MVNEFYKLNNQETELVLKAPLLVCILIAGADDQIERKEIKKAIAVTQEKQLKSKSRLTECYRLMAEDFEDKLKVLIQGFPPRATDRNPAIVKELSQLSAILKKIEPSLALEFYKSLREIAHKVAQSSGGLLGLNSIGAEEAKFITLPMIDEPI